VLKEDPISSKYQPEDEPQMVETCSWLTYYFYKVVFLTAVNLLLFILQHNAMYKAKIDRYQNMFFLLSS
jgi:hypothetical protein